MEPIEATSGRGVLVRMLEAEFALLTRYRRVVVTNASLVVLIGFGTGLVAGDRFEAHTSILPPPTTADGIGAVTRAGLRALGLEGVSVMDEIAAVAKSRRILEPVIDQLDLRRAYDAKTNEHAYLTLLDRLRLEVTHADVLHLRFVDASAERAAEVLGAITNELNGFYVDERRTRGRLVKDLVEARVDSTRRKLAEAQVALGSYQAGQRVVVPSEPGARARAFVGASARAMALDVEIDARARVASPGAGFMRALRYERDAIASGLGRQPAIALEAIRLQRDLEVQETLLDMLTFRLAEARGDAMNDVAAIEVLDPAEAPPVRIWPGHARITFASLVISLAAAVLLVHTLAFVERNREALRTTHYRASEGTE